MPDDPKYTPGNPKKMPKKQTSAIFMGIDPKNLPDGEL